MKYKNVLKARFIERKNRFIANVEVDGVIEKAHIKNTGRCNELFLPDAEVYLSPAGGVNRKTKYDLVALKKPKNGTMVNVDSQAPNRIAEEWIIKNRLFSECAVIRREVRYNRSRFDLYVEDGQKKCYIEIKGVTLEKDGIALFPDAPTERGVKHLNELIAAVKDGYDAWIVFVIKMKGVTAFKPNRETHSKFAEELLNAKNNGVKVIAFDCLISPDEVIADKQVDILL